MIVGLFTVLAISGRLTSVRERVNSAVLTLPAGFEMRRFLRLTVVYTLAVETAGALALYHFVFASHAVSQPAWQAIFHSVSAFCTAGFGLFNDSFESYRGDRPLNGIIMALSYLGAIGFIVINDAWHALTRRGARVTLTSKIILLSRRRADCRRGNGGWRLCSRS